MRYRGPDGGSRPQTEPPTCTNWRTGWLSVGSRPWRWSRPGCTGFHFSRSSCSAASRCCWSTPRNVHNVGGRKSDVSDCEWLRELHSLGLLRASFRPAAVMQLRSYLRQRETLVEEAATRFQRMQKALSEMNLKLHTVLTDITGQTGLTIVLHILKCSSSSWRRLSVCSNEREVPPGDIRLAASPITRSPVTRPSAPCVNRWLLGRQPPFSAT